MEYITINVKTKEGKMLFDSIRKHKAVKVLRLPNSETKQALRKAKMGEVEVIKDVKKWFDNIMK